MKIHILSNSLRMNSGFSIVSKNVARGLKKLGYQVTFTGMQTAFSPEFISDDTGSIEIIPIQVGHIDDMTQYMLTLGRIKPDVVLNIFQADYEFNDFPKVFKKCIWYAPVEGRNIPQKMTDDLLSVKMNGGEVVAQCRYGQEEMQLALGGLIIPYIYHGYDPDIFKPTNLDNIDSIRYCYYCTEYGKIWTDPVLLCKQGCYNCRLDNKDQVKCPFYKEEHISILRYINNKWTEEDMPITGLPGIMKGKLVYLFVGQNLGVRKRIERLLRAYSIFINQSRQYKDRAILHIHSMPIAVNGVNLIKVIQDLGIQDNVIFSYGTFASSGWSDQGMNILYNTADVNVSASSGEGWGLPTGESMACGIPNIGPDCSSFTELIGDGETDPNARGYLAKIGEWQMIENQSERALVNESDLALLMKKMFVEKDNRERFGKNGVEFMKSYTWEKMCQQWDKLLKSMKDGQ